MDVVLSQRIRGLDPLTVWHGIHADTVNHNPHVTAWTTSTLSLGLWRSIWFISIPVEFRRVGGCDLVRWGLGAARCWAGRQVVWVVSPLVGIDRQAVKRRGAKKNALAFTFLSRWVLLCLLCNTLDLKVQWHLLPSRPTSNPCQGVTGQW